MTSTGGGGEGENKPDEVMSSIIEGDGTDVRSVLSSSEAGNEPFGTAASVASEMESHVVTVLSMSALGPRIVLGTEAFSVEVTVVGTDRSLLRGHSS